MVLRFALSVVVWGRLGLKDRADLVWVQCVKCKKVFRTTKKSGFLICEECVK